MKSLPSFAAGFSISLITILTCAGPLRAQLPATITGADNGGTTSVNIYSPNGTPTGSFSGAGLAFGGGIRVGFGDVTGDGYSDIITGEGVGGSTLRVYTGATHTLTYASSPFGAAYGLGLYVAGGDINHDGHADIIVGAGGGAGSTPQIKILSGADGTTSLDSFLAFSASFTGGVRVASGDVNGDGFADIIAGSGIGSGALRVFSGKDLTLLASISAFGPSFTGGIYVAATDVNHDGFADIITGTGSGLAQIKVFSGKDSTVLNNFLPFGAGFSGEVRVAGLDLNNDGFGDLIAGQGPGGSSIVSVFDAQTLSLMASFQPYGPSNNGVFVGAIPEPSTLALLGSGVCIFVLAQRQRQPAK